ncbi:hypothetical protein CTA1_12892 [Colletotrichum tanaceti]|uniref:Uncharacterized protein n=1 Tax=Colletotrichum tanaceti TaxID=1306861 RepID=A0A4U6X6U6_9PEZI|nr:hypothetical protein CTA1_12892 [Colletotrichum tanaceti]
MGVTGFYGKGKTVDTSRKFTVVTQFSNNKVQQYFVQNAALGGKMGARHVPLGRPLRQHALARLRLPSREGRPAQLGSARGDCPTTSGVPGEVESSLASVSRCAS